MDPKIVCLTLQVNPHLKNRNQWFTDDQVTSNKLKQKLDA